MLIPGADPEIFQKGGGGLRRKILKEKCLLIHLSTRVHMKTRQICNSFSLLPFQEDGLLYFALFFYSLLFLKFERGVATPVTPLLDPPMNIGVLNQAEHDKRPYSVFCG